MKRLFLAGALWAGISLLYVNTTQAATITDVRVSGAGPVTFGQVFAPGDVKKSDVLVGSLAGIAVPLQVDTKATYTDGSVRHAIISAQMPKAGTMQINTGGASPAAATLPTSIPVATVTVGAGTIGGIKYSASSSTAGGPKWLAGPVVNEWQTVAPLTNAAGVAHPHLTARFAIRYYTASKKTRVDVTVENNWAFEPGPQNFTYDTDISVDGTSIYRKATLTHYHHTRWHKVFWDGPVVQMNTAYLIASKAVPNYDQTVKPSAAQLAGYGALNVEPMGLGLSNSYMPMTGGNDGIGLLPAWSAAYVLSMDDRARNAMLATADGAGSYSAHFRDKNTDRPVSLVNFPYMTQYGNYGDTWNPTTNKMEAFPGCGGDCTTPYTHDIPHQPSMAYLPYVVTGDYFYLEEMQFWAMFDAFASNPGYRENIKGLVTSEQLRGQAWALRALAQAAAFTPDEDPLKSQLVGFVNNNLDWYNKTYTNNPAANKLGVLTNGFAVAYNNGTATAPWMDDFFTSAVGHAADLGFDAAKPLLAWKAKFTVGRMTAPGVCWINGAPYQLTIRDTDNSPVYDTLAQAYKHDLPDLMALPCASSAMAAKLGLAVGDMGNISNGYLGYPSNMQPALAYSVDYAAPDARKAWNLFMSRTVKPDYSLGQQFNIVPRAYTAAVLPPLPNTPAPTVPAVPVPTANLTSAPTVAGTWTKIADEGASATVAADTTVRYGSGTTWLYAKATGSVPATNVFFKSDPTPNIAKTLQAFTPPPVAVPTKVTTPTNTKLVKQGPLTVVFIDSGKLTPVKTFIGVTATSKGAFTVADVLLIPGSTYLVIVANSAGKPLDAFLLTVPK